MGSQEKTFKKNSQKSLELGYDSMEALSLFANDNLCKANIPIGQRKL